LKKCEFYVGKNLKTQEKFSIQVPASKTSQKAKNIGSLPVSTKAFPKALENQLLTNWITRLSPVPQKYPVRAQWVKNKVHRLEKRNNY